MNDLQASLMTVKQGQDFKNYRPISMMGDSSLTSMLKEWFFSRNMIKPEGHLPYKRIDAKRLFTGADSALRVTWLGHSSFIVELDGLRIMLDPVLSGNTSPVPWLYSVKRFQKEAPIGPDNLPAIDAVLISHDHYDHLDKKTIKAIHSKVAQFIVPLGVDRYLLKWGVPASKITALGWSESADIGRHSIAALPAQHFSGRGFKRARTLWVSYAVTGPHHNLYFSGDTGYHEEFKRIGERYGAFDMVLLDSGQYGVHWPYVHMFPEEAVQAFQDLGGSVYVPMHWGSFNLANHDWWEPIERALAAAAEKGVNMAVPHPGATIVYGEKLPTEQWWNPGCLSAGNTNHEKTSPKQ